MSLFSVNIYATCKNIDSDQTIMLIDNNYESQFYTLSVDVNCKGEINNLIKRVYSISDKSLLETVVYPIEINVEKVMIQRLKMKDIVRFKVLELDATSGIIQVSYAKKILAGLFNKMNVIIKYLEESGWQAYDSKGIAFNHLEFNIKTKFLIPHTVALKKSELIEIPSYLK